MEKPNYYAIIPAEVRYDNNLTPNAKLLYGEISALSSKTGECWASNSYFMNLYQVEKNSIQRWLKELKDGRYITSEDIYKEGSKEIEKRIIKLMFLGNTPSIKNDTTPSIKNDTTPSIKNDTTPSIKNDTDNNTSINNTSINISKNKSSDDSVKENKEFNMNSKSYKSLIGYINSTGFKDDVKQELINWYEAVAKGKVSIKQLKDKLQKIWNDTNGNQDLIKVSINNSYLSGWVGFYLPKQYNYNQNTKTDCSKYVDGTNEVKADKSF